jgi:N,N'-diacetyllegionaminate synthase
MTSKLPIIIAEVGVNHNGKKELLKKFINKVSEANVDFIKFQSFISSNLVVKNSPKAKYQKKIKLSQYEMLKKYELKKSDYDLIFKECKKRKLKPLFSVFDIESLNYLKKYKIKNLKIPSGEITNQPLLEAIGKMKINIFMSTGMSNIDEIKRALNTLKISGTPLNNISVLHCHSDYPSQIKDLNLKNILTLKKILKCKIGYSDHSIGDLGSIVATSLGAYVLEKHITLNKNLSGPDHSSSLDIKDLREFVQKVHNVKIALGNLEIQRSKIEEQNKKIVRKSLVAKKKIKKGDFFSHVNLTCKRPGSGLSPFLLKKLIGSKSKFNFQVDQLIKIK